MLMRSGWSGRTCATVIASLAIVCAPAAGRPQAPVPEATLYRIFLADGSTLVSYGEYARVADLVVFSMVIGGPPSAPRLQLLSMPASAIDWTRTDAYTEAARAARYAATRGPNEYAQLGDAVSRALNDIALTTDPARRLDMAVEARRNVSQWPAQHYGYRAPDVAVSAAMFDEVISDLRAKAGQRSFDLSFVANIAGPPYVPMLPAPGPSESAEQALRAASLVPDAGERMSLLRAIAETLGGIDASAAWATPLRARAAAELAAEERIDRDYTSLRRDVLRAADHRARAADVTGMDRLFKRVLQEDDRLGHRRPQETASLLTVLDARLEAARRLRLARDQWAMRREDLRRYQQMVAEPQALLRETRLALEQIRQLSGPRRRGLRRLTEHIARASRLLAAVTPPVEGQAVYGLLRSALQMAGRAADTRLRAVRSGDMNTAWEASSAAAGALMLFERASEELERLSRPPDLK